MGSIFNWFRGASRTAQKAAQAVGPDLSRFAEGDRVLIDGRKLSGPLHVNQQTPVARGFLAHNDIIGKRPRDLITANKGDLHRVSLPNLDQYVALTPRKVTPIYATYASLVVSLLDIHVAAPTPSNEKDPPLEILEAGTGHGALTLHLAQAIHAANPPPPWLPPPRALRSHSAASQDEIPVEGESDAISMWKDYRSSRRAIIHTTEVSSNFSLHAEKIVRGFRRGIYSPHVDFHVAPVEEWISSQVDSRRKHGAMNVEPFLSYVILDMPDSYKQIGVTASVMKDGALMVVFVPSITQIGDCVREIEEKQIPLEMEKVVELGEGISNGRQWDVRLAKRRAKSTTPAKILEDGESVTEEGRITVPSIAEAHEEEAEKFIAEREQDDAQVMVCRPKVGRMTIGGGFVGLWRRPEKS